MLLCFALALDRWPGRVGFAATAVALFHCHPLPAIALVTAVGALALFWPAFQRQRGGYGLILPCVLPLTLPWLLLSIGGLDENSSVIEGEGATLAAWAKSLLKQLAARTLQFWVEISELAPWLLWLLFLPMVWRRGTAAMRKALVVCGTALAALAAINIATQNVDEMWQLGARYAAAWIPLGACVTAALVSYLARGRWWVEGLLLSLIVLTHVGDNAVPWVTVDPHSVIDSSRYGFAMHLPPRETPRALREILPASLVPLFHDVPRLLRLEVPAFFPELWASNPGTVELATEFLEQHADADDLVITNYEGEPLYFHSELPQAYKIPPWFRCYEAARLQGLPESAFSVREARWIVWRMVWEEYRGYRLQAVLDEITRHGGRAEPVFELTETRWENRENIHFHRFPTAGQLYVVVPYYHVDGDREIPHVTTRPHWPRATIHWIEWPDEVDASSDAASTTAPYRLCS